MPAPPTDLRPAPRRPRVRTLMVAVALAAVVLAVGKGAFWYWNHWGKVQYCRGWGEQHAEQARESRRKAADPKLSPEEAQEFRMEARRRAILARKYLAVAADPTLPYPGTPHPNNPMLTPEEIAKEPDRPVVP